MTDSRAENVEPLAGFKISAMQKQLLEQFQRAIDDVELRKVALQSAAALCEASLKADGTKINPVELARAMHAFLSEPAREVLLTVKQP